MVAILMISAKLATLDLKMKEFYNKSYDLINLSISHDSNYIVDVVR